MLLAVRGKNASGLSSGTAWRLSGKLRWSDDMLRCCCVGCVGGDCVAQRNHLLLANAEPRSQVEGQRRVQRKHRRRSQNEQPIVTTPKNI